MMNGTLEAVMKDMKVTENDVTVRIERSLSHEVAVHLDAADGSGSQQRSHTHLADMDIQRDLLRAVDRMVNGPPGPPMARMRPAATAAPAPAGDPAAVAAPGATGALPRTRRR